VGREREGRGRAHLGIQNPAITVTGSPRARGGRERWKRGRGSCCAGKIKCEREGEGARGGTPGRAGLGQVGLGQVRLGRVAGRKFTAHPTTDRNPTANRNSKRGEMNTRLNTISDKRNMFRHDATLMST
jgi:hypothetical protein